MVAAMINFISQSLFISAVLSSVILFTVLILRKLFSDKLPDKILKFIWLIVILRLVLPITFQSPVYVRDMFINNNEENLEINDSTENIATEDNYIYETSYENNASTDEFTPENETFVPKNTAKDTLKAFLSGIDWIKTLFIIWLLGAVIFLSYSLVRINLFKKKVFLSDNCIHKKSIDLMEKYRKLLNIEKTISVRECAYIQTPVIMGVIRPILLMPKGFLGNLDNNSLSMIILHEMCHIKSNDILKNNLWLIAKAFHWYNPLVWMAYQAFLDDMEKNCDQMVLSYLENSKKVNYFDALLKVVKLSKYKNTMPPLLCFCKDKSKLRKRVDIMINPQRKYKSINIFVSIILIVTVFTCFTTACTGIGRKSYESVFIKEIDEMATLIPEVPNTPQPTSYDVNEDETLPDVPKPVSTAVAISDNTPENKEYSITRIYDGDNPISMDELKQCNGVEIRNVNSFDFLKDMDNIKSIYISSRYLDSVSGDISVLATLNNLESLNLNFSKVTGDIDCLKNLTKLRKVFLGNTLITGDISSLKNLIYLQKLDLGVTQVTGDIKIFENMPYLQWVALDEMSSLTGDIKALENCKMLEEVYMGTSTVSGDIAVFKNMPYLQWVALEMTNVSGDISAFKDSQLLRVIYLFSTHVGGDLSSLENLNCIELVDVAGSNITGTLNIPEERAMG